MSRISILFFIITTAASQQTITVNGEVKDVNGNPFPKAQIKTGQNSRDSIIFSADKNGYFKIKIPKSEPRNLIIYSGKKYGIMIPLLMGNEDSVYISIVLDSTRRSYYQFANPNTLLARYAQLHPYLMNGYEEFVTSLQNREKNGLETRTYLNAWMDSAAHLKSMSLEETDSVIRGEYLLRYYRITSISGMWFDTSFYQKMVLTVPMNSPLWFFNNYETFDQNMVHPKGKSFIDSMIEYHPSRELRAFLLFETAKESQYQMRENETRSNFIKLKEEYGDIWWGKIADQFIFAKMNIKKGTRIPNFLFKDMNDSTLAYSNGSLIGKTYLLDFWATWCLPCIGEIPFLQKAYDKYQSKGFQIISVSSDLNKSDVYNFRKQKYAMPWNHAWLSESEFNTIKDLFEISGIPKPILVDKDGIIVGIKGEVRSVELERTLSKLFQE